MELSNLECFLNSVKTNLQLNAHTYVCAYYQRNEPCDCDKYSDEELVSKIALEFGYAFFPLEILKDYPLSTD